MDYVSEIATTENILIAKFSYIDILRGDFLFSKIFSIFAELYLTFF
jgi:hypothetical protein